MSRAGSHRRRALRDYRAALRATQPPSEVAPTADDCARTTPVAAVAPTVTPVMPVALNATDSVVLRIVNWNTPEETERRRAEATAVMLRTMGTTSPYL